MVRHLISIALLVFTSAALAEKEGLVGTWAVRADGQTVMIIDVSQNDELLTATKSTPQKGYINKSHAAVDMGGPVKSIEIQELKRTANGVEFAPKTDPTDIIVLTLVESDLMILSHKSAPSFQPILFTRARKGETVALDWSAQADWLLDERWPDNVDVARLFKDDQTIRKTGSKIDWNVAQIEDAKRREAVEALLDKGKLRSGNDFYHAAFIFQHGQKPGDFLKAHGLAVIAAAKGRRDATWIAATTLDRYLLNIGQKQIYGTQYRMPENEPVTQEPYNRTLLSDAMLIASGVPDRAQQALRRKEMDPESAKRNPVPK